MTKEYEERKGQKPPSLMARILTTVVKLCLFIVALLFLLMVAFPKGLWVGLFSQ